MVVPAQRRERMMLDGYSVTFHPRTSLNAGLRPQRIMSEEVVKMSPNQFTM